MKNIPVVAIVPLDRSGQVIATPVRAASRRSAALDLDGT